jgi:hypothetical protein
VAKIPTAGARENKMLRMLKEDKSHGEKILWDITKISTLI